MTVPDDFPWEEQAPERPDLVRQRLISVTGRLPEVEDSTVRLVPGQVLVLRGRPRRARIVGLWYDTLGRDESAVDRHLVPTISFYGISGGCPSLLPGFNPMPLRNWARLCETGIHNALRVHPLLIEPGYLEAHVKLPDVAPEPVSFSLWALLR